MELAQFAGVLGAPFVVALVNMIKDMGASKRWSPLYAIVIGMVLNILLAVVLDSSILASLIMGLVTGGVASGYYDTVINPKV